VHFFFFNEFAPVGLRDAFRTAARKRASSWSRRRAASFTSRSASVPAYVAIWESESGSEATGGSQVLVDVRIQRDSAPVRDLWFLELESTLDTP
jgi:hypothetical protein